MNTMSNKQSKRRQPATESQEFVSATGRSFKRLRLDPDSSAPTSSSFFSSISHHSSSNNGDISLDNNYFGEDERELHHTTSTMEDERRRRMNQKHGMNHSSAESGDEGESMASSWVASLQSMGSNNNGLFRRSRQQQQQQLKMSHGANNNDDNSNHNGSCDGYYNNDDISCAAMTTAAVAPRKRRYNSGNQLQCRAPMKKSVKYHPQQFSIDESNCNENNIGDDDLQVEELDMMNMKPSPNKFVSIDQNNNNMPDPLLVAAQHAMVGGGVERQHKQQQQRSQPNPNNISSVLLIGECCSSVTEEETSLAEDEASLSAISIGANTIMSALSGPGDGKSVALGAPSPLPLPQPATAAVAAASTAPHQFGAPSAATTQPSSDFSSLNNVLGGLHRERMARRNSSFHSLGSDGCHTHDGSVRSMPNHSSSGYHRQNMVHLPPPTAYVPKSTFTAAMQSHAEDEEMEDAGTETVVGGMEAAASAGSSRNSREDGIPKWKRRVNLQSHSSLY